MVMPHTISQRPNVGIQSSRCKMWLVVRFRLVSTKSCSFIFHPCGMAFARPGAIGRYQCITWCVISWCVHDQNTSGHHSRMQPNQNLRKGFGQRVRELRTSQSLSQEAFADKCGFVRTYMSRIETGTANPSLDAAKVIADGLGMTLSELLQGL